jgi:hypothetical protein
MEHFFFMSRPLCPFSPQKATSLTLSENMPDLASIDIWMKVAEIEHRDKKNKAAGLISSPG